MQFNCKETSKKYFSHLKYMYFILCIYQKMLSCHMVLGKSTETHHKKMFSDCLNISIPQQPFSRQLVTILSRDNRIALKKAVVEPKQFYRLKKKI